MAANQQSHAASLTIATGRRATSPRGAVVKTPRLARSKIDPGTPESTSPIRKTISVRRDPLPNLVTGRMSNLSPALEWKMAVRSANAKIRTAMVAITSSICVMAQLPEEMQKAPHLVLAVLLPLAFVQNCYKAMELVTPWVVNRKSAQTLQQQTSVTRQLAIRADQLCQGLLAVFNQYSAILKMARTGPSSFPRVPVVVDVLHGVEGKNGIAGLAFLLAKDLPLDTKEIQEVLKFDWRAVAGALTRGQPLERYPYLSVLIALHEKRIIRKSLARALTLCSELVKKLKSVRAHLGHVKRKIVDRYTKDRVQRNIVLETVVVPADQAIAQARKDLASCPVLAEADVDNQCHANAQAIIARAAEFSEQCRALCHLEGDVSTDEDVQRNKKELQETVPRLFALCTEAREVAGILLARHAFRLLSSEFSSVTTVTGGHASWHPPGEGGEEDVRCPQLLRISSLVESRDGADKSVWRGALMLQQWDPTQGNKANMLRELIGLSRSAQTSVRAFRSEWEREYPDMIARLRRERAHKTSMWTGSLAMARKRAKQLDLLVKAGHSQLSQVGLVTKALKSAVEHAEELAKAIRVNMVVTSDRELQDCLDALDQTREHTSLRIAAESETVFRQERLLNERDQHQRVSRARLRNKVLGEATQALVDAHLTLTTGHKQLTLLTALSARIGKGEEEISAHHKTIEDTVIDITATPPMREQLAALEEEANSILSKSEAIRDEIKTQAMVFEARQAYLAAEYDRIQSDYVEPIAEMLHEITEMASTEPRLFSIAGYNDALERSTSASTMLHARLTTLDRAATNTDILDGEADVVTITTEEAMNQELQGMENFAKGVLRSVKAEKKRCEEELASLRVRELKATAMSEKLKSVTVVSNAKVEKLFLTQIAKDVSLSLHPRVAPAKADFEAVTASCFEGVKVPDPAETTNEQMETTLAAIDAKIERFHNEGNKLMKLLSDVLNECAFRYGHCHNERLLLKETYVDMTNNILEWVTSDECLGDSRLPGIQDTHKVATALKDIRNARRAMTAFLAIHKNKCTYHDDATMLEQLDNLNKQLLDNFVRARQAKVVVKSIVTTAHLRGAEAEALRDEVRHKGIGEAEEVLREYHLTRALFPKANLGKEVESALMSASEAVLEAVAVIEQRLPYYSPTEMDADLQAIATAAVEEIDGASVLAKAQAAVAALKDKLHKMAEERPQWREKLDQYRQAQSQRMKDSWLEVCAEQLEVEQQVITRCVEAFAEYDVHEALFEMPTRLPSFSEDPDEAKAQKDLWENFKNMDPLQCNSKNLTMGIDRWVIDHPSSADSQTINNIRQAIKSLRVQEEELLSALKSNHPRLGEAFSQLKLARAYMSALEQSQSEIKAPTSSEERKAALGTLQPTVARTSASVHALAETLEHFRIDHPPKSETNARVDLIEQQRLITEGIAGSVKKTLGHRLHRGIKMVLMANQTRSFHSQSKRRYLSFVEKSAHTNFADLIQRGVAF